MDDATAMGMIQLNYLNRLPELSHIRRVTTFRCSTFECFRRQKDGSDKGVKIEILDHGEACPSGRFSVRAESEDGKKAFGNGDDDLQAALAMVHWGDLD